VIAKAYANYQRGAQAPSGFTFISEPAFDLDAFPKGTCNYLSTIVIIANPTITIAYDGGNSADADPQFDAATISEISLFGLIAMSNGGQCTFSSAITTNSKTSFTVTMTPSIVTSIAPVDQQATVLGVVVTPAAQSAH
jgi:hypothetical protein